MNTPKTLIFVGRSGAGKGTQLDLLKKYLSEKGTIASLDMGNIYRTFFSNDGYVQEIARDISMNQGKFQPDFLTNALFTASAVNVIDGTSHLFVDGFPRSEGQLQAFRDLMEYTKRSNPVVLNIEVSRENVKKRMLERGRGDDEEDKIESRLNEYDRTVVPMLEVIKNDPTFEYLEIDGEPSIEEIHKDIVSKLGV